MRKAMMRAGVLAGIFLAAAIVWGGEKARAELLPEEKATVEIFEKAAPAVAFIKNAALKWSWYSQDIYEIPQGVGSGFVWDLDGHVITNFHVIYGADTIDVIFSKEESYKAKVVGVSPDYDLAVLKINAPPEKLRVLARGSSRDLKVGQRVLAIGNPFGLDHALSTGVVSALGRSIRSLTGRKIYDVIQTDAAINPGNSGGPLLDSSGELIGVATAIYSPSGASAGVGFAIPVDIVKQIVPQLIRYGKIRKVGLGVTLVPDNVRNYLGISGAMVLDVPQGSAAEAAGLQPTRKDEFGEIIYGDIIVMLDDQKIESNDDLSFYFEKHKKSGDQVKIQFIRDQKPREATAVLQEL